MGATDGTGDVGVDIAPSPTADTASVMNARPTAITDPRVAALSDNGEVKCDSGRDARLDGANAGDCAGDCPSCWTGAVGLPSPALPLNTAGRLTHDRCDDQSRGNCEGPWEELGSTPHLPFQG